MWKQFVTFFVVSLISSQLFAEEIRVCQIGFFTDTENVFVVRGANKMDGFFQYEYDNKIFMIINKEGREHNTLYYIIKDLESGHLAQADLQYPTLSLKEKVSGGINDLMYSDGKGKAYYITCAVQKYLNDPYF